MAKNPLAGFKDPVRRPRYIIWTGVVVLAFAVFMVVALGATSTRWFCAQVCHSVQDDSIAAYENSTHSEISCMACHEPVNADTVTFMIAKVKSGLEVIPTVMNTFELPLNPGSALALKGGKEMGSQQCTQCHSANREVTPSPGMIIDHKVHEDKGVWCTVCHNRIAHNEIEVKLTSPSGEPNKKHENFMRMDACFRCHTLEGNEKPEGEWQATGKCSACHTPEFPLKPASHAEKNFLNIGGDSKGHAELAVEKQSEAASLAAEAKILEEEGIKPQLAKPVDYCKTCHVTKTFCLGCHGMEMPHPEEFKTKTHPEVVKTAAAKCVMCHGDNNKTWFCDHCHHGSKINWTYQDAVPWRQQHATASVKNGIDSCFTACHKPEFCYDCHSKLKPFPTSHRQANWLHRANPDPLASPKVQAVHASSAKSSIKSCEICHGAGGTTSAFCSGCHKLPMPHPADFKSFHAKTGSTNPKVCANCHTFKELCSNCHHAGASLTVPWRSVHAGVVAKNGGASCFAKCHKKDFCIACHTKLKALPASHKQAGWTKRPAPTVKALHPAAWQTSNDNCTYCHGDGGPSSAFCMNCHKMPMPHPAGFGPPKDSTPGIGTGGTHETDLRDSKLKRESCQYCHGKDNNFCNACHHKDGFKPGVPWLTTHDDVVKAGDPQACFKCHKETYCSYCHVRLLHR